MNRAKTALLWKSDMNKNLELLYHSLLFSLEQEYEHYQELLKIIKEESTILVKGSLPDILEFNTKKERLLLSLNMATEMRISAIKKIAIHLNLEEPVAMRQLIAYAQNQTRQNLIRCQEKFSDLLLQIQRINENSKGLISFSIAHLGNTLKYINVLTSSQPNYDQSGHRKAGNLQGRLISKEG